MSYVLAVLVGAVWGVAMGFVNMLIMRAALKKNKDEAFAGASIFRTVLDLAAFVVVFLLRNILPLPYTFVLVGTAAGLSITTIVLSYRLAGKK
ncbi:MAG: hypothetical protein IJJ43_04695 [Oscillospiraceae bacterium]|nr:hypothetical protein [Oscillospiraceae bacterium]